MKLNQETIINRLKAIAEARYNQGWDTFVECYDHADWLAFTTDDDTGKPMTWAKAYGLAVDCVSVWRERQAEAASYYDGYSMAEAAAEAAAMSERPYRYASDDYDDYDREEAKRDDGDEDDDGPREPLQFIPHAEDYLLFD
jgi:hypothetical protein